MVVGGVTAEGEIERSNSLGDYGNADRQKANKLFIYSSQNDENRHIHSDHS